MSPVRVYRARSGGGDGQGGGGGRQVGIVHDGDGDDRVEHFHIGRVHDGEAQELRRRTAAQQGGAQGDVEVVATLDDERHVAGGEEGPRYRWTASSSSPPRSWSSTSMASTRTGKVSRYGQRGDGTTGQASRVWEISARSITG